MINQFFSCLYGYPVAPVSGIYVGLRDPLVYRDVLVSGLQGLRGGTPLTAETFAIQGVKVVDASTYAAEILIGDPRVTYRTSEIGAGSGDSLAFLAAVVGLPGDVLAVALEDQDVLRTYRSSKLISERAAAVLVGIVRRVRHDNGL